MKYIAIRKEPNGSLYMDKNFFNRFTDADLGVYRFTKVAIAEQYFDKLSTADFDEHLMFSESKYNERIQREADLEKLPVLIKRLEELTKDFVRVGLGAVIEDIEDRKTEYRETLDEVRRIQGKEPVMYINTTETE